MVASLASIGTYYVATDGNDAWSGTLVAPNSTYTDGPFKTLNKAKDAMESSAIKTTTVRGGTYSIDGTDLTFSSADNGETWIPYHNETPIIDGGTTYTVGYGAGAYSNLSTISVTHDGGWVTASGVSNLTIEGLTFDHLGYDPAYGAGKYGIMLNGGSGDTFRWNTVKDAAYQGLNLNDLQSSVVDSNTFDGQHPGNGYADSRFYQAAYNEIGVGYGSSNTYIGHNQFSNIDGIAIGIVDVPTDPPLDNNLVDRNLILSATQHSADAGALYMTDESAASTGTKFTNNKILGGGGVTADSTHAIYIDGSTSNVTVSGNIAAYDSAAPWETDFVVHGGANDALSNNIFEVGQTAPFTDIWGNTNQDGGYLGLYQTDTGKTGMSGNTLNRNILFSPGAWPSEGSLGLYQIDNAPNAPSVSGNDYWSLGGDLITNVTPDVSPHYDNPMFAGPATDNYAVGTSSLVWPDLGWQAIPTDQGPLTNPFLTSSPITFSLANFGTNAGGWTSQDAYPRALGDVNGDGLSDIVGFGSDGADVSFATGGGKFSNPISASSSFGTNSGWTSQNTYPREMADVNGDGKSDIIGFGADGVYIALSNGNGTFGSPFLASTYFGTSGGWTSQNQYPRELADVTGNGRDDIVAFASNGVYVSLANPDGSFAAPILASTSFGANNGWTSQDAYPRELADVNGDGKADLVGSGAAGVYVALSNGDGTFGSPFLASTSFGANNGWTSQDAYPRELADVNGDGKADIVGFAAGGVYTALGNGDGTFQAPVFDFGSLGNSTMAGGWTSQNTYPRLTGNVASSHNADILAFASDGVYTVLFPTHGM
jgi:VCBS repeat protein/parallel beta helix pectate lyase-like protein